MRRRSALFSTFLSALLLIFALHCQNAGQNSVPGGRILLFQGSSTATTLLNTETLEFASSAALPEALGTGASSFRISAGTHSGKVLTILGQEDATSGKTYLYDSTTNSFSQGAALFNGTARPGAHFDNRLSAHLQVYVRGDGLVFAYDAISGTWNHAGWSTPGHVRPLVAHLGSGTHSVTAILHSFFEMAFYDHATNFAYRAFALPAPVEVGANLSIIGSGGNAGNGLLITGGGMAHTMILTNLGGHLFPVTGPNVQQTPYPNFGSCSIAIDAGIHAGRILVVHGGASNVTSIYDATANNFVAGPLLTAAAGEGAHIVTIKSGLHAGKFIVIHGNNSLTSSLYDVDSGQFGAGPNLPFNLSPGGHSISID